MSLLLKALIYRENYIKSKPKGLMAKALNYLESKELEIYPNYYNESIMQNNIETLEFISNTIADNEEVIDFDDKDSDMIISELNKTVEEEIEINSSTDGNDDLSLEIIGDDNDDTEFDKEIDESIEDFITDESNIEITKEEKTNVDSFMKSTIEDNTENNSNLGIVDIVQEGINQENKNSNIGDYLNNISLEIAKFSTKENTFSDFLNIFHKNYNLTNSGIILYIPEDKCFKLIESINFNQKTMKLFEFDLETKNIYKIISDDGYILLNSKDSDYIEFSELIDIEDLEKITNLLISPFIFSSRIIGFLIAGRNNYDFDKGEILVINILNRLNGHLLYNLYQTTLLNNNHDNFQLEKKKDLENDFHDENQNNDIIESSYYNKDNNPNLDNQENNTPIISIEESKTEENFCVNEFNIDQTIEHIEETKNENSLEESINYVETNQINSTESTIDKIEVENESHITEEASISNENYDNIDEIFDKKYHRIIYYLKQTIDTNPATPLSILRISISNKELLEKDINNFNFETFMADVQFIVMNIVGSNGLVSMFNDFNIFAILPEIDEENSAIVLDQITNDIKIMFLEIFGTDTIEFNNKIVSYPKLSKNFIELFYNIINHD